MDGSAKTGVYEFGPFRVDASARQLCRESSPIHLSAKAFDALLILVSQSGETVTRERLMNAVWDEAAVEDNNLTQQISTLRKAFGEHRFIVTVPRRGYCFVGDVRQVERPMSRVAPQRSWLFGRFDQERLLGYALAMVFVAAICFPVILTLLGTASGSYRPQSLAVLQFRSDAGDEFIGTGISDTLRARLGSVEDLVVRPRGALPESGDIVAAGRELAVDAVVTGSVQRIRGRIRITVEMVDVADGRLVWGRTFDDDVGDVFVLQDSIASEVARALHVRLRAAIRSLETSTSI